MGEVKFKAVVSLVSMPHDVMKWKRFPRHWHFVRGTTGGRWFPSQGTSNASFVFFDISLNKKLNKQLIYRWFETPRCSLWRHCNAFVLRKITKNYVYDVIRSTANNLSLDLSWIPFCATHKTQTNDLIRTNYPPKQRLTSNDCWYARHIAKYLIEAIV